MRTVFRKAAAGAIRAFALLALAAGPVAADQIVLRNGDRITGSIVKKDEGKLTIDSKHFGVVTVTWEEVESIRSDEPLTVVLSGGDEEQVRLRMEGQSVRLGEAEPSRQVARDDIAALRNSKEQKEYEKLLRPGLLDLWVISGSINLAGARGNAGTSTFTTPVNFLRSSRTSKTTAYFNAIRSVAIVDGVSSQTARAIRGGWAYSRNVSSRAFLNIFNDNEYDKFQSLDLRTVAGGGAGYRVWKGEPGDLGLVAGISWNREAFSPSDAASFSRRSAEAYWGDDLHYRINARTNLVQSFRMFHNLSNRGEFRMTFDAGATVSINKWLTWNVSVTDRYLSNPVPGRLKNDLLYTTGLGFTYSR